METKPDLSIEGSPNTFHRIQNDGNYMDEITKQVMETQGGDFEKDFIPNIFVSEVLKSENAELDTSQPLVDAPSEDRFYVDRNDIWLEAPTKLLLSLLEELRPKVGKTFQLKSKTKMWHQIQQKMSEEGYSFTVAQVQGKYRSLERRYKKTKLHNSKTGRNRHTWPYESELDKLIGERRGLYPEFVLDSESAEGTSREELIGNAGTSYEGNLPSTSDDSCKTRRRPRASESGQQQILNKLDEIRKEKVEYHSKILKFLENKEQMEKERNKLLTTIAENLSK